MRTGFFFLFITLIIFFYTSCDDAGVTVTNNLELSGIGDTAVGNSPQLVLDTVKVLLKEIKLNIVSSDDSTNFKTETIMVRLNIWTSVTTFTSAQISEGTYDKLKFEIHKLESNETPPDPDFSDINGRYSVVVKGRWNDTAFVFKTDVNAHQILLFPGNLVLNNDTKSNITLKAKPFIWFKDENGNYVDPRNTQNKSRIDNNIKNNVNQNLRAFKDNDKDGNPD
jgi:hypothetical protein